MNIMLLFSGLVLANKEPSKVALENITGVNVVEQYKVIPSEIVQQDVAKKATTSCRKKATPTKKKTTKKKVVKKKTTKKKAKKKVVKKAKKKSVRMNVKYNKNDVYNYAYSLVKSYGWSDYDWECLVKLWNRESGWNSNAVNRRSGACGIPQSLPCSKMAVEGTDYRTNYRTQIRWGIKYIANRYGSPSAAWGHSQKHHWY